VGLYTLVGEDDRDLATRFEALQRWMPGGALDGHSLGEFADGALVGTAERIRERVADFEDLGVEEIIASPAALPFASFDPPMIELLAQTVAQSANR
jgi:alkanesulfonate monooxygenase SsuD/methylene tetrahydromethanopterin reductase-like flavin-dependent oxidoreductase (luciferase family)